MNTLSLYCPACDKAYDPADGPLSCPRGGEGGEHVLEKRLGPITPERAFEARAMAEHWTQGERDPLTAFAPLSLARQLVGESAHAEAASALQESLTRLEGRPVTATPLVDAPALARALGHTGPLRFKDETGQVAGSHKARHLAGAMLWIQAVRRMRGESFRPELAISSCGNAALAAAAVARASGYSLRAFVPEDVDPEVARMLAERGTRVEIAPRVSSGQGDPCYLAFRHAVTREGCLPFCCSGRDNWANIEGGQSLGYEAALQWAEAGTQPDCLVLQVGGGALARAVATAFEELKALSVIDRAPRIHVCQTEGCFPFVRAYLLLLAEAAGGLGLNLALRYDRDAEPAGQLAGLLDFQDRRFDQVAEAARLCADNFTSEPVRRALKLAARQPERFLWAWDGGAPQSLAHGILDDETYDWFALARSLLASNSLAVAVPEPLVRQAHNLARHNALDQVSATGSSGLAGYLALRRMGAIAPHEGVGLFFTGIKR